MSRIEAKNALFYNDKAFKFGDVVKLTGLAEEATGRIINISPDEVVLDLSERFISEIKRYRTSEFFKIEAVEV